MNVYSLVAVLMFGILGLRCPLLTAATASPQQPEPLKAEVDAVLVNLLVTDQSGRPILGLEKENFRVFEDKVEQQILNFFPVDAPFSVGLLLDTSFSTYGKLAQIQNSAIRFLEKIHPDDEVTVISFDDEVHLETDFTRNKDAAARAVKMTRTGEFTRLYDAVFLGMREIRTQPHRKVIILFTDGIDTASSESSSGETIEVAKESEVTIYSIHFDTRLQMMAPQGPTIGTPGTIPGRYPGPVGLPTPMPGPSPVPGGGPRRSDVEADYQRGRNYLKQLAEVTGGKRFEADENLFNLGEIFAQIAEEMRSLYSISYVSSNLKKNGKFRKIIVRVDVPQARVRARKGYYGKKGR